jgi:hypothetical protein
MVSGHAHICGVVMVSALRFNPSRRYQRVTQLSGYRIQAFHRLALKQIFAQI